MYKLVFRNEHFLIVDKESNVLTVPSRMGKDDERHCLGIQLGLDFKTQIMPVHRLDFEVSGLVMFATHKGAQMDANLWFERKQIQKTYEAQALKKDDSVRHFVLHEPMVWECMLMKGKKRAYEAPFGKKAITKAELIAVENNVSIDEKKMLEVHRFKLSPVTGRSHQLRFELFRHGYPIIGDSLYGSSVKLSKGIALRSYLLDFRNCPHAKKYYLPDEIIISGNELAV